MGGCEQTGVANNYFQTLLTGEPIGAIFITNVLRFIGRSYISYWFSFTTRGKEAGGS